nr:hypothetical transcript [Hymenolepis microstoma]
MYPFQVSNLANCLQSAFYLPLQRRQAIIHPLPYQLLRNSCACNLSTTTLELQGFAEDSDLSQFFFHTHDNRILKTKFLWYEDDDTRTSLRGFFFLRHVSESSPYHLRIRSIKLCKTTSDLLLLSDTSLDFFRRNAPTDGLLHKRSVQITPELCNAKFAQEPSLAMPESFQPSTPHDLAKNSVEAVEGMCFHFGKEWSCFPL